MKHETVSGEWMNLKPDTLTTKPETDRALTQFSPHGLLLGDKIFYYVYNKFLIKGIMGIGRRFVSTPVNAYQTLANCLFLKKLTT